MLCPMMGDGTPIPCTATCRKRTGQPLSSGRQQESPAFRAGECQKSLYTPKTAGTLAACRFTAFFMQKSADVTAYKLIQVRSGSRDIIQYNCGRKPALGKRSDDIKDFMTSYCRMPDARASYCSNCNLLNFFLAGAAEASASFFIPPGAVSAPYPRFPHTGRGFAARPQNPL